MSLVAIIPAKGYSRNIPRKNLVEFGGKPLLAWTIEACALSCLHVFVSTEDPEISDVAKQYGADVINRPKDLCADHIHSVRVILHAINHLNLVLDTKIGMFHPTSPFRRAGDITASLALLKDSFTSVIGVVKTHPRNSLRTLEGGCLCDYDPKRETYAREAQRHEVAPLYSVNGSIYISTVFNVCRYKSFHKGDPTGYVMLRSHSVDINDIDDLVMARKMI